MNRDDFELLMLEHLDSTLSPEREKELSAYLERHEEAASELEQLRSVRDAAKQVEPVAPPPGLITGIHARLEQPEPSPFLRWLASPLVRVAATAAVLAVVAWIVMRPPEVQEFAAADRAEPSVEAPADRTASESQLVAAAGASRTVAVKKDGERTTPSETADALEDHGLSAAATTPAPRAMLKGTAGMVTQDDSVPVEVEETPMPAAGPGIQADAGPVRRIATRPPKGIWSAPEAEGIEPGLAPATAVIAEPTESSAEPLDMATSKAALREEAVATAPSPTPVPMIAARRPSRARKARADEALDAEIPQESILLAVRTDRPDRIRSLLAPHLGPREGKEAEQLGAALETGDDFRARSSAPALETIEVSMTAAEYRQFLAEAAPLGRLDTMESMSGLTKAKAVGTRATIRVRVIILPH